MKYYNVTSTTKLNELLLDPAQSTFPSINEVCNWILNGFNACIISYGEKQSGKTQSLFGTHSFTHSPISIFLFAYSLKGHISRVRREILHFTHQV